MLFILLLFLIWFSFDFDFHYSNSFTDSFPYTIPRVLLFDGNILKPPNFELI